MKAIVYARSAEKTLSRLPTNLASRIVAKVKAFANDPASQANNVVSMKGSDLIRLRVGDWRVIIEDDVVLLVLRIGARGSVYD